jgi:hypothetical protein
MRIRNFKIMFNSIQSSAGPKKIRPEDGLPASKLEKKLSCVKLRNNFIDRIYQRIEVCALIRILTEFII